MAALLGSFGPSITFRSASLIARTSPSTLRRALSTLPDNPDIYVHEQSNGGRKRYIYSYLPQAPPIPSLTIGSSPQNPPTPESLEENHEFMKIMHWAIKDNAPNDPEVQGQAAMYASQAGSALGSGGAFFPRQRRQQKKYGGGGGTGGDGAGGASAQGGMGGAGRGGYIHVSDQRNPPDFGRVAWPEDIFGSLELDGDGKFVDGTGRYQESGTYRIMTHEGMLGLSPYLKEKVKERLKELDMQARKNS
ncbi:hypothetical protein LTR37_019870 [Vermiconidia calcicola]|uniref:Uncharacterized protein n=1 Tax=Vermiconidia calcicola TaxID=1690605 RepID=A0ACC3MET0_9PEZI|nr:hypothetical protein LTR37_019870 [Vermiconidia calcicola]